jgi:hypothetical protein
MRIKKYRQEDSIKRIFIESLRIILNLDQFLVGISKLFKIF